MPHLPARPEPNALLGPGRKRIPRLMARMDAAVAAGLNCDSRFRITRGEARFNRKTVLVHMRAFVAMTSRLRLWWPGNSHRNTPVAVACPPRHGGQTAAKGDATTSREKVSCGSAHSGPRPARCRVRCGRTCVDSYWPRASTLCTKIDPVLTQPQTIDRPSGDQEGCISW